jgi:hypothetical protein
VTKPAEDDLTDQQKLFVEYLFGEAKGKPRLAATMAGYTNGAYSAVVKNLRKLIIEKAEHILAMNAAGAVFALEDVMEDGTLPGASNKLIAAKEVLDRVGIVKHDKLDIKAEGVSPIFILPAKDRSDD